MARANTLEGTVQLTELIETTVSGMGYELVDLDRTGRGMLCVYIDQPSGIARERVGKSPQCIARDRSRLWRTRVLFRWI